MDNWRILCLNFHRGPRPNPTSDDYAILWGGIYSRYTEYEDNGSIQCLSVSSSQYRNSVVMFYRTSPDSSKPNYYSISSNIITLTGNNFDVFDATTYYVYIALEEL